MKRGREPEDDTANGELENAQVRLIAMRIVCSSATPLAILQLNPSTVTSGDYTISPFSICHSRTLGAWAPIILFEHVLEQECTTPHGN